MKKSILTIGLFSLVMILTSFTMPETVSPTNIENNNLVELSWSSATTFGTMKLDIDGSSGTTTRTKKLDIDGSSGTTTRTKKLDIDGSSGTTTRTKKLD